MDKFTSLDTWSPTSNKPDLVPYTPESDPPSPVQDLHIMQPFSLCDASSFSLSLGFERSRESSTESEPLSSVLSSLYPFQHHDLLANINGMTLKSEPPTFCNKNDFQYMPACGSQPADFFTRNTEHLLDSSSDSEPSSPLHGKTSVYSMVDNNLPTQKHACANQSDADLKVVVSGGELMVEMRGHVYPIDTIIEPSPPDSTAEYSSMMENNNYSVNNNNNINKHLCRRYELQKGSCHACEENRQGFSESSVEKHHYSCIRAEDDRDVEELHRGGRSRRQVARTERLWEFILRLLGDSKHNPRLIEWVERSEGTFRLNNSKAIALMWGMRKNNAQMTYEKLSRALRYYYHRKILEPVLGKKLVYRFGPNASPVWETSPYRCQGAR